MHIDPQHNLINHFIYLFIIYMMVDALRFSCVSPGGTVFTPTGVEVIVPVDAIIAWDLDIDRLPVLREARNFVPKWRLSSDGHSALLELVSESLEQTVANAVRNVSGRS